MIIFLALTLVPLLIIGRLSFEFTEELIVSMVIRQLENVAADKAAILERWIDERKADLMVVAGTSLLKTMDPEIFSPYLELIHKKYGVYKDLIVVSTTNEIIFKSRKEKPVIENNSNNEYIFRQGLFISDITYAQDENESSFLIAAPVIDDEFKGTVYGSVGTNEIIVFILNVALGATGECFLVDKDGRFLAHKQPHRILTQNISQSDSFRNIFEKRDHKKAYLDYRGIEVLGASLKVGGTDWYIVVEQDSKEAFQSAGKLKRIISLTLLLCITSAFMLTWIISHHIVNPIRKLSEYASAVANSQPDNAMVRINRNDEIGILYRAVEEMSSKLRERQNHLEQKIGLREAELKKTDMILKKTALIAEHSEKLATMGRMGAAIAHEIRTPLTSIKLFLESVQAETDIAAEYEEDFHIAMNQINRIEATINRFLDFAKPQDPVFVEINLAKLIGGLLVMIRPQVNRQECFLDVTIDNNLPAITGDRRLLSETLINLFINALESMPNHGTLSITASRDLFSANGKTRPCVRIDIKDTGHGIAEDQIEKIFEPFYTTKATGTGLGMPLVLKTIRNHGGVILIKSKIYEGTTFSLFLPITLDEPLCEPNGKNITY